MANYNHQNQKYKKQKHEKNPLPIIDCNLFSYLKDKKYPVLYLLHGIGGDETEWQRFAAPNIILDNLLADGKLVPMIVAMPNGRAQKNDRAEGDIYRAGPAFANFEHDLLDDVIPAIEARYS